MPTLHDRLAELADEVSDVVPPRGLWGAEQRRRGAVRRYTLVVAAAALALVGLLLGAAWQVAQPPAPASPRGEPGLPDRVYQPSRWLHTAGPGELGQLVAVRSVSRSGWWGDRPGVVGLSALTGEYAFLDLPDLADEEVALSPDGRYVAYWTTGTPSGSPNTQYHDEPITGVSVYDAGSGEVRHAEFPTDHGLGARSGPFFVDGDTLVLSFGQILAGDDGPDIDQLAVQSQQVRVWRLSQPTPEQAGLDPRIAPDATRAAARGGRFLSTSDPVPDSTTAYLVDLNVVPTEARRVSVRFQGLSTSGPVAALSPDGGRLARLAGPGLKDKAPNRISVSSLSPRAARFGVEPERILQGSAGSFGVVSWLDDDHLAVLQVADRFSGRVELRSLDVDTGATASLVQFAGEDPGPPPWAFAPDLLTAPSVEGREPPRPWDPRWVAAGIAGVLTAAGLLIGARRRTRAFG